MPNFMAVSSASPDQRLAIAEGLADVQVHLSGIMYRVASEKPGAFETMEGLRLSLGEVIAKLRNVQADVRAIVEDECSTASRQLAEIDAGFDAVRR